MEQLINTATMPYYAMAILFILGGAFLFTTLLIFAEGNPIKEEAKLIIALLIIGVILLASGFHCKNIYSKNINQVKSIAKNVIAKEYPDATDFNWMLETGSFTNNGTEYKIEYQKTISNEEKLVVTTKKEQSENKNTKTFDIPKGMLK